MTVPLGPANDHGLRQPAAFYDALRSNGVLGQKLSGPQVDGCEALLMACRDWPLAWTAYGLATPAWETGRTMQPVREKGSGDHDGDGLDDYLERYDTGRLAIALGNTPAHDGDGQLYAGRGYVQLTGLANYRRFGAELALPLVTDPDLALRTDVAARVLTLGMGKGLFTGRKLDDFLPAHGKAERFRYIAARRIINGQDKAEEIADMALDFEAALIAGGWRDA